MAEVVPVLWPESEPVDRHVLDAGEAAVHVELTGGIAAASGEERCWLTSMYPVPAPSCKDRTDEKTP